MNYSHGNHCKPRAPRQKSQRSTLKVSTLPTGSANASGSQTPMMHHLDLPRPLSSVSTSSLARSKSSIFANLTTSLQKTFSRGVSDFEGEMLDLEREQHQLKMKKLELQIAELERRSIPGDLDDPEVWGRRNKHPTPRGVI